MITKLLNIIWIALLLTFTITFINLKKKKKKIKVNKYLIIVYFLIGSLLIFNLFKEEKNKFEPNNDNTKTTTKVNHQAKETTTTSTRSTTTTNTTKKQETTTRAKKTTTTTKIIHENNNLVGETKKGYKIDYKDGAYYIGNTLIVNKTYLLSSTFTPTNSIKTIPSSGFDRNPLNKEAYDAWILMKNDAAALGLNLWAQSGYRSYDYQKDLYNSYVNRKGKEAADKSSARPGASEHQTGLAFDLNTITTSFKDTAEGKWVNQNCFNYGYIIRYPENKTNETGYIFEPWHIRYVGKELAKELYNNGNWITMEDYFGIESKYSN